MVHKCIHSESCIAVNKVVFNIDDTKDKSTRSHGLYEALRKCKLANYTMVDTQERGKRKNPGRSHNITQHTDRNPETVLEPRVQKQREDSGSPIETAESCCPPSSFKVSLPKA
ncbi:hypothetical protein VNO77_00340 [Canavalia gladiata]|uniref:Uncharacterized protein n=1 Tax=Canavalia gladiata TaxID=3824 RepID=A0AAN9R978_CANGL